MFPQCFFTYTSVILVSVLTVSFPLLFSLGLIIVMLSLLALLRFSFIRSPLATNQQPHSVQNISHLLHIVSGIALPYLSDLLRLYSPSRSLRSASDTRIFRVSRMGRRTLRERSFQYIGPVLWNSLPLSVRHSSSLYSFKSKVITHLFSSAY